MTPRPSILALLVASGLGTSRVAALVPQRADSQAVLRAAHAAQAAFERTRRWHLPYAFGRSGGECEERIGRFCYWHDGGADTTPPEEPRRIREARARLIAALDSAATRLPGDEWIAGQRVRYLVEDAQPAAALVAARSCRAAAWWCEALAGFALHAAGDFTGADTTFQAALRTMPVEERCRWTDISLLLDDELHRRYRRLGCKERGPIEARVWWLAQPLYLLPANDRRTEHFARMTMARLQEGTGTTYGLSWGADLRELLVRYGWPTYWTQERSPSGGSGGTQALVTGHEPSPSFNFLPAACALEDPVECRADEWQVGARRPQERYAPPYAAAFVPLEHQAALFRRGDSALVVAAYDLRGDTLLMNLSLEAALVLARDERVAPVIRRETQALGRGVLVATAEWGPLLFSLELLAAKERRAARARYGLRPPEASGRQVSVSDLLLFDPPLSDSLPRALPAVIPHTRGSARVLADWSLGLFWETYGLDPGGGDAVLTISVTVVQQSTNWLRRATESLGLVGRRTPVRLRWQERAELEGSVAARSLVLDLSSLSSGRYRIEVAVRGGAAGQEPATAAREIRIVGR